MEHWPGWRKEEPADRGWQPVWQERFPGADREHGTEDRRAEEGWEADIPYKKQTSETRAGRIFLVLPLFRPVCILPSLC